MQVRCVLGQDSDNSCPIWLYIPHFNKDAKKLKFSDNSKRTGQYIEFREDLEEGGVWVVDKRLSTINSGDIHIFEKVRFIVRSRLAQSGGRKCSESKFTYTKLSTLFTEQELRPCADARRSEMIRNNIEDDFDFFSGTPVRKHGPGYSSDDSADGPSSNGSPIMIRFIHTTSLPLLSECKLYIYREREIYIYIYTYTFTYLHIYIFTYLHIDIFIYLYFYIFIY